MVESIQNSVKILKAVISQLATERMGKRVDGMKLFIS